MRKGLLKKIVLLAVMSVIFIGSLTVGATTITQNFEDLTIGSDVTLGSGWVKQDATVKTDIIADSSGISNNALKLKNTHATQQYRGIRFDFTKPSTVFKFSYRMKIEDLTHTKVTAFMKANTMTSTDELFRITYDSNTKRILYQIGSPAVGTIIPKNGSTTYTITEGEWVNINFVIDSATGRAAAWIGIMPSSLDFRTYSSDSIKPDIKGVRFIPDNNHTEGTTVDDLKISEYDGTITQDFEGLTRGNNLDLGSSFQKDTDVNFNIIQDDSNLSSNAFNIKNTSTTIATRNARYDFTKPSSVFKFSYRMKVSGEDRVTAFMKENTMLSTDELFRITYQYSTKKFLYKIGTQNNVYIPKDGSTTYTLASGDWITINVIFDTANGKMSTWIGSRPSILTYVTYSSDSIKPDVKGFKFILNNAHTEGTTVDDLKISKYDPIEITASFKDNSGIDIGAISPSQTITIPVSLTRYDDSISGVTVIAALYANGVLEGVSARNITFSTYSATDQLSLSSLAASATRTIKVFVWSSLDTMKPYATPILK